MNRDGNRGVFRDRIVSYYRHNMITQFQIKRMTEALSLMGSIFAMQGALAHAAISSSFNMYISMEETKQRVQEIRDKYQKEIDSKIVRYIMRFHFRDMWE